MYGIRQHHLLGCRVVFLFQSEGTVTDGGRALHHCCWELR